MRRLPSLSAIEAFIHVARSGTVKAAAEELALSSPAISRRIQGLEAHISKPLFERRHQSMVLTDDGEALLALVSPMLDSLSDAIEGLTSDNNIMRLRLGVLPLYATQRLMPRLAALRALHPNLHLDVDTAAHALSRLGEGIDAAITIAKDIDPSLYSYKLDHDQVLAIGSTQLRNGPKALVSPVQIRNMTVILHRDMPETFTAWAEAIGMPGLEPAAVDYFDSGALMLEAAAQQLGIAFLHESHFDDAQDSRLVPLFDIQVESPYSYWFACRPRALQMRPVRIFHDWLIADGDSRV